MRKIIDSNRLQSEELRSYLRRSNRHFAVLTDYAAMEAYKGDTLASIFKSMEVVAQFPQQIIVLKSTSIICGLNGRQAGLQRRLIDKAQTSAFGQFVTGLNLAKAGNVGALKQLLEHGKDATEHLECMLKDAATTGGAFDEIGKAYSKDERGFIREGSVYTSAMVNRIMESVIVMASDAFKGHPKVTKLPSIEELPNTFIFRAALCTYLLAIFRAAEGSSMSTRPEKLRNDMIDANFSAYATYFDGILSADQMVLRVHQEARLVLSAIFGCHMHSGWLVHG